MITINRKGLDLTTDDVQNIPAEGSKNIPVKLTQDDSYADYIPQIHCGFIKEFSEKEIILEKDNDHWLIPAEAFARNGPIYLSVGLVKNDEIIMTRQQTFCISKAPHGNVILPNENTWQMLVENYVEDVYQRDYKSQFDEKLDEMDDSLTELNNTIESSKNQQAVIQEKLDNGFFVGPEGQQGIQGVQGQKGDKGDTGESGVITQINGFFTLSVDENGDLWAHHSDDDLPPQFEYDSDSGDLYLIT